MRSIQSRLMNLLLRALGAKKMFVGFHQAKHSAEAFQAEVSKARSRNGDQSEPTEAFVQKYPHERIDVDGFALHIHQIGKRKRVGLFLHGGAYVLGISSAHWSLIEKMGIGGDCHMAMFDYPLAPEHDCTAAIEHTLRAYEILVERYGAEEVVLMGGSAGAGLAMALSLHLRDQGRPQPRSTVLLYPWLDVTMSHPYTKEFGHKDLLLGVDGLIACGEHYAGDRDTTDPLVSPWFGQLDDVAPVYIFSGTWDILHGEGRDFVEKIKSAGGEANLSAYPEMQHAWMLFGMPEAKKALEEIFRVLKV
ncbi:MAG: alpha/beta hydrolase fold domain-containing protein [Anaerolineae bacterium]